LEEWAYQDGGHSSEEINYIVLESGNHDPSSGVSMFAGKVTADGSGWKTVNFDPNWNSQSYVYSQVMTLNDSTPVTTRVTEFGTSSFDVICQEEESNRSGQVSNHAEETIGFIATQPQFGGAGDPGESVASIFATDGWSSGSLEDSYPSTPVMIHRMQSYFGRDTTTLRARNQTETSFEVLAQEEKSANTEVDHVREYAATFALEPGPIETT
jgi:hypothetical protein